MSGTTGQLLFDLRAVPKGIEDVADQVGMHVATLRRSGIIVVSVADIDRLEELQRELMSVSARVAAGLRRRGI